MVALDRSEDVRQSGRRTRVPVRFQETPPGEYAPRGGRGRGRGRRGRDRGRGRQSSSTRERGSAADRQRMAIRREHAAARREGQSPSTRERETAAARQRMATRREDQSPSTRERETAADRQRLATRREDQSPSTRERETAGRSEHAAEVLESLSPFQQRTHLLGTTLRRRQPLQQPRPRCLFPNVEDNRDDDVDGGRNGEGEVRQDDGGPSGAEGASLRDGVEPRLRGLPAIFSLVEPHVSFLFNSHDVRTESTLCVLLLFSHFRQMRSS